MTRESRQPQSASYSLTLLRNQANNPIQIFSFKGTHTNHHPQSLKSCLPPKETIIAGPSSPPKLTADTVRIPNERTSAKLKITQIHKYQHEESRITENQVNITLPKETNKAPVTP